MINLWCRLREKRDWNWSIYQMINQNQTNLWFQFPLMTEYTPLFSQNKIISWSISWDRFDWKEEEEYGKYWGEERDVGENGRSKNNKNNKNDTKKIRKWWMKIGNFEKRDQKKTKNLEKERWDLKLQIHLQ